MFARVIAFTYGMREFRLSWTKHYASPDLVSAYDLGREWAHRITFRRYEEV